MSVEGHKGGSSYICSCCGQLHENLPSATFRGPDVWAWASEVEREADFDLNTDLCIWRNEHFFVRCVLDIPIINNGGTLSFGVWSSLSASSFDHYLEHWDDPDRANLEPLFGWFSNSLPGYPETLNLKCHVVPRNEGMRPLVELEPTDHPLSAQQRDGVTIADATAYLHEIGMLGAAGPIA